MEPRTNENWHDGWTIDRHRSIKLQVYGVLRQAIVGARLPPGRGLSEKDLAELLGVSRTPVREALSKLADEGLVVILPQSGSFVAPLSYTGVIDAQYIRELLECGVVADLARRITAEDLAHLSDLVLAQKRAVEAGDLAGFHGLDEAFHRTLAHQSGHPSVWTAIDQAKVQIDRVRRLSLPDPGRPAVAIAQHEAILAALTARDVRAAGAAMRRHLREVLKILDELRGRAPGFFLPGGEDDPPPAPRPPRRTAGRRRAPVRNGYRFGALS
ncbi:GntR family transcriptional regulator [Aliidongia dinghuensis]|uniref:GntR family transcriptional regulator n=1 Tax=Aliidongia dinghuensis TaxID=1867774 RepID=A0A8J3E1G1_9PROT|nr:GntR family transcriptional regulator [Aliidongia dinghuensis]GGF01753.1 GntR family transcriptional regulator [Aliidongia dinghuensis]